MSRARHARPVDAGFTLVETLVAMLVLAAGFLGLAQMFTIGLISVAASAPHMIAREKASEALESIYTARDARTSTWAELQNVGAGGVFAEGAQPLTTAGEDGLINTPDDGDVEVVVLPGSDGELGTDDDRTQPLSQFTREVVITDVGPNLRRVRILIRYPAGGGTHEYAIETLLSAFA